MSMRRMMAANQRPDTFRDVTARFAQNVWTACATEEMNRAFPNLTVENFGAASAFWRDALTVNLRAVGLL